MNIFLTGTTDNTRDTPQKHRSNSEYCAIFTKRFGNLTADDILGRFEHLRTVCKATFGECIYSLNVDSATYATKCGLHGCCDADNDFKQLTHESFREIFGYSQKIILSIRPKFINKNTGFPVVGMMWDVAKPQTIAIYGEQHCAITDDGRQPLIDKLTESTPSPSLFYDIQLYLNAIPA